jgi:hypothetical protein
VSHTSIRRSAKAAAILTLIAAVAGAAVGRHVPRQQAPLVLSLQFAESANDVRRLTPPTLQANVLRAQRDDAWFFIPSYWALFCAAGVVMVLSGGTRNRTLGIATIAVISVTAVLDYGENAAIAAAFVPGEAIVSHPARWAVAKWTLLFVAAGLLGAALMLIPRRGLHAMLAGGLLNVAAIVGIGGALFAPELVQSAVAAMAAGLLLLALLWIWNPAYLARPA